MTTETDLQAGLVKATGPLTIYEVAALREDLLAAFGASEEATLDLAAVTECDTAGAQLICSARITSRETGKPLNIRAVSDAVSQAMESVGMDTFDILNP